MTRLEEQANTWMEKHPDAMAILEDLAQKAAARKRKFGVRFICELVRWEYSIVRDDSKFKISNNLTPYLGRYLVNKYPEMVNLIELREIGE